MKTLSINIDTQFEVFGDDVIISGKLKRVTDSLINITEDFEESTAELERMYRFSFDGKQFSTWKDYSESITIPIREGEDVYLELKYILANDDPIQLNSIELEYQGENAYLICPLDITVTCYDGEEKDAVSFFDLDECANNLMEVYNKDKIRNIYNNVNKLVNATHGHEVKYFKVKESELSSDPIFKEYMLHDVVATTDMNITIPNNEIPLNQDMQISAWDMGYRDLFEIHIMVDEFCKTFGQTRQEFEFDRPEQRDFLFLPVVNRMFEVEGVEAIDQRPSESTFWKVYLKTFTQHGDTTHKSDLTQEEEDAITFTADEQFEEEMDEGKKYGSPSQSYTGHQAFDPKRKSVNVNMDIVNEEIDNNFTIVSRTNYDLRSIDNGDVGVLYKNNLRLNERSNFHFSGWVNIHNINEKIVLFDSDSNQLDININQGSLNFKLGNISSQFTGLEFLENYEDQWISFIIEGSNSGNWVRMHIYEIDDNVRSTKLNELYSNNIEIDNTNEVDCDIRIIGTPTQYTNIRVLTKTINTEDHSNFLNKNVIPEDSNVLVVDQAMKLKDDRYFKKLD